MFGERVEEGDWQWLALSKCLNDWLTDISVTARAETGFSMADDRVSGGTCRLRPSIHVQAVIHLLDGQTEEVNNDKKMVA